jgi:hypothetical protein
MARLPQPGSDNGTWGDVLNDYLSQTLKSDGTLKDDSVTNAAIASDAVNATSIADGSITEPLLATAVQTKLNDAGDWNTLANKPAVIAAGADQAAARTAIGAGTSSLVLGATSSTAKAGDYQPASTDITDATATGRSLVTATDAAAVRATIGADGSKVQITDNCYCVPAGTGSFVGSWRWFYRVGVSACDVQLVFANWSSAIVTPQIDVDASTSHTFKASVQDASGNNYPITFSGVLTATFGPGPGPLISDPVNIDLTKGDQIAVVVYTASGTYQNTRTYAGYSGGGGFSNAVDYTAKGATAVADINSGVPAAGPGPIAIIGTPLEAGIPKALVEYGDSTAWGSDLVSTIFMGHLPTMSGLSGGGFIHRAVVGEAGFIQGAINYDRLYWFNDNYGHWRRGSVLKWCRYAFIDYGHNDLYDGKTAAQLQQDILTCCARNKAQGIVKNIIMTLMPHTTSTDRWATLVNQTLFGGSFESNRLIHNNWVRDGGPIDSVTLAPVAVGTSNALRFGEGIHPVDAYLEVADITESARDSGKWKIVGRSVNDAVSNSTTTITSATASFTSADVGASVIIGGAGTAGADYRSAIRSVTNSTTVVMWTATATNVSSAQMVIGELTSDGVHPYASGHKYIADAIQNDLLALLG